MWKERTQGFWLQRASETHWVDYGRGGSGGRGCGLGGRGGSGGGGRGGKFKGKCHKCDKWGHKASECKPPGDGASTSGDSINTKETAGVALGG